MQNTIKCQFHLAIPSKDISESMSYYAKLGCKLGRFNDIYAIIDFFGNQVVCHKSENIDENPKMYPRHFGAIVDNHTWRYMLHLAQDLNLKFFEHEFTRYPQKPDEHKTFFLIDPSNNIIEFKTYQDERMI